MINKEIKNIDIILCYFGTTFTKEINKRYFFIWGIEQKYN